MKEKCFGDLCHENLVNKSERKLSFYKNRNNSNYKKVLREKFEELLKIKKIENNSTPINIQIEEETEFENYNRIRFCFESEIDARIPAYLLIPKNMKKSVPIAITLQGHTTGFHISIGVAKYDSDNDRYFPNNKFALQAVENGFAALCIELRGMGELASPRVYGEELIFTPQRHTCAFTALTALNLGRTLLGERIWDVKCAIDSLEYFKDRGIDTDKIMITGNSGGGTLSFYAACYDERIKYCAPSCSFCSYKKSIMDIEHCVCNYIPNACEWFEMEDLAALIAPRSLTVLAGKLDPIFPIDGVRESFETVKDIYSSENAEDKCDMLEMPKAHYWCDDLIWRQIKKDVLKIGFW